MRAGIFATILVGHIYVIPGTTASLNDSDLHHSGVARLQSIGDALTYKTADTAEALLDSGLEFIKYTNELFRTHKSRTENELRRTIGIRVLTKRILEAFALADMLGPFDSVREIHRDLVILQALARVIDRLESHFQKRISAEAVRVLGAAAHSAFYLRVSDEHLNEHPEAIARTCEILIEITAAALLQANSRSELESIVIPSDEAEDINCDWVDLYQVRETSDFKINSSRQASVSAHSHVLSALDSPPENDDDADAILAPEDERLTENEVWVV